MLDEDSGATTINLCVGYVAVPPSQWDPDLDTDGTGQINAEHAHSAQAIVCTEPVELPELPDNDQ